MTFWCWSTSTCSAGSCLSLLNIETSPLLDLQLIPNQRQLRFQQLSFVREVHLSLLNYHFELKLSG